jgi:hypothetical protein
VVDGGGLHPSGGVFLADSFDLINNTVIFNCGFAETVEAQYSSSAMSRKRAVDMSGACHAGPIAGTHRTSARATTSTFYYISHLL